MNACADLVANASAGAAPALRAVDCLANQTAGSAFARLFGSEGSLLPALTILLTIYIAIFAFSLITGRSRLGVSVLTPRMMVLGLVLTFATSWMAWQQVVWNLAVGAPDQIAGLIMGESGSASVLFADRIDMVMAAIAEVAAPGAPDGAAQQATSAASSGAFSPQGAMWLGTMLLLLGTVGVLVTSRIALAVLLATGPVFVVMALFGPTRGLTVGWLRALLLTAVVPLFVTLGGSLMLELVAPVVAALRGGDGAIDVRAAMALFLLASVHCALMVMMLKVAGTMVSAWNVLGLASHESASHTAAAGAPVISQPAPATIEVAASPSRSSTVARASAEPMMMASSSTHSSGAASQSRTQVVHTHSSTTPTSSATSLPRLRARGIGSRFASARTPMPKEMIR